jgi:hypothetical protein
MNRQMGGGRYNDLLRCQGRTLRDWISHSNDFHKHLQEALIDKADFSFPEIFVVDDDGGGDDEGDIDKQKRGSDKTATTATTATTTAATAATASCCSRRSLSMLVHYRSTHGTMLAPLLVGIIKNAASMYFDTEAMFHLLKKQGEDGSPYTVWRVIERQSQQTNSVVPTTVAESSSNGVTAAQGGREGGSDSTRDARERKDENRGQSVCTTVRWIIRSQSSGSLSDT